MRKPAFCICENKDADQLRSIPIDVIPIDDLIPRTRHFMAFQTRSASFKHR